MKRGRPFPRRAAAEVTDKPRGGGLSKADGVQLAILQLPDPPMLMSQAEKDWWRRALGCLGFVSRLLETHKIHGLQWSKSMLSHYRTEGARIAGAAPDRLLPHAEALIRALESAVIDPRG